MALAAYTAHGQVPDILGVDITLWSKFMTSDLAGAYLLDITNDVKGVRDEFYESRWIAYANQGQLYGVESNFPLTPYYKRVDLFERYKVPEISTWDDFLKIGASLHMMRQFITQSVPTALLDAARIDGASEIGVFLRIVLPTVRPALAALAVWQFLTSFNSFIWPLVVISDPGKYTIPVGLNSLQGTFLRQYGTVIAGAVLSAVPAVILFWVLRKKLIEGLTVGAVKG